MPPAWDEDEPSVARLRIEPSAVTELFWRLFGLARGRVYRTLPGLADEPALAEHIHAFWTDDYCSAFSELLVLAHRGGHLADVSLEPFLTQLDSLAAQPTEPLRLVTESADEAAALLARLDRLRRDRRVRARYLALLRAAWTPFEPLWRTAGLPAVRESAHAMRERLARGTSLRDLLAETHITRRHHPVDLAAVLNAALENGAVLVTPSYLCSAGGHILDLPGLLHVGVRIDDEDPRQRLLTLGEHVARRVKVLADASRVAILADLIQRPASITELAERFELAQPTVSMHVKLLRDAELLRPAKNGSRTTYSVDRERLECLFDDVEAALLARGGAAPLAELASRNGASR